MDKKTVVLEMMEKYDSFYLYDEREMLSSVNRLKLDFQGVEFLYSMKANPAPAILKTVFSSGLGADAASLAEVLLAHKLGVPKEKIQYSAPGKRVEDIAQAMEYSTLIADSVEEVWKIQEEAKRQEKFVEIGIRINPNFTFSGDGGVPSKFGIDEALVFQWLPQWREFSNIKIVGIHIHSRSQELNAAVLGEYYEKVMLLAASVQRAIGRKLRFINMGSGFGIPYGEEELPLDTEYLGKRTAETIGKFKGELLDARIIIETGRYVVGKSGWYVTKVLDRKESMGRTYIILNNTLNGFLRPSLSRLVMSYAADTPKGGGEPLFTRENVVQFLVLNGETKMEEVTLVGNLCTGVDVVAQDILLPKLREGDAIAITNAGSYGAVLSPMQFSSQTPPEELFLSKNGVVTRAKDAFE